MMGRILAAIAPLAHVEAINYGPVENGADAER